MTTLTRVENNKDIALVVMLAKEIWHQHFTPIIGIAQVEYMLDKFHSAAAIAEQLDEGWQYYLAMLDGHSVGYTAVIPDIENHRMMLSKLYVLQAARRQGVGKTVLDFIEQKCRNDKIDTLWLTVNRGNAAPIDWYRKRGFEIVKEEVKDIGEGFVMDDYIMQKSIR